MRKKNKKVSLAKKPFLVLSRRAIAGWLAVVFLVSAWMFAVGVLVGRGTSPLKIDISDLQQKLDAAMAELKQKKQGQARAPSGDIKDNEDLKFYDVLKKNREDTASFKVPLIPPAAEKPEPPADEKSAPPASSAETPAASQKLSMKRLTKSQHQAAGLVESAPPEPAATSATPPGPAQSRAEAAARPYAIQVAAFKAAGDADQLVAELQQKGFSAYRAIGKVPGSGIWYRVRIGNYQNRAEADDTMARLKKAGQKPVLVEK